MEMINSTKEILIQKLGIQEITSGEFFINLLVAIGLIILGVLLGKLIKFTLRKIIEKINLDKFINLAFIDLFLTIVKWSIYILFINMALIQLNMPTVTGWLTAILSVLPALTGALIILSVGFGIASYMRKIISESKFSNKKFLAQIVFIFTIYIFIIFAMKTALIAIQDRFLSNSLIILFSVIGGIYLIVYYIKENN